MSAMRARGVVRLPSLPSTKTEHATEMLRRRIRSGEFEPGEPLRIDVLTRELGMSSTPVREALRLLQADRLVDYHPHRGTTVAGTSRDDPALEEVYRLRMVLEPYATELAVGAISDKQLARVEQLHASLVRVTTSGRTTRRASEYNSSWHFAIYAAAGMPLLVELIQRLWDAFPWRTMWAIPDTVGTSTEDHDAIMEAVRARNSKKAAALMHTHIGRGLQYLLAERAQRDGQTDGELVQEAEA